MCAPPQDQRKESTEDTYLFAGGKLWAHISCPCHVRRKSTFNGILFFLISLHSYASLSASSSSSYSKRWDLWMENFGESSEAGRPHRGPGIDCAWTYDCVNNNILQIWHFQITNTSPELPGRRRVSLIVRSLPIIHPPADCMGFIPYQHLSATQGRSTCSFNLNWQ